MKKKSKVNLEINKIDLSIDQNVLCCGVDEVGRGCLAGPVYAGAVCLDYSKLQSLSKKDLALIRDSKTLSLSQRLAARELVLFAAKSTAVSAASSSEIESLGIVPATFLAMRRALSELENKPGLILVDGKQKISEIDIPQQAIVKGDSLTFCIAAASILAKLARDAFMVEQDKLYPGYFFADHVGYGTKAHLAALSDLGPVPIHRKNFAPISRMISNDNL